MDSINNVNLVVGILHIISHFDYEKVYPQGPTIALAALNINNPEIKECAVMAYENWSHVDSLSILKAIKVSETWLQEYINQVIKDIEEDMK